MALIVTKIEHSVAGSRRTSHGTLSLDSSYPAGGYAVTPRMFSLGVIDPGGLELGAVTGLNLEYEAATGKVRVYQFGALEVPTGYDLSAAVGVGFRAEGI